MTTLEISDGRSASSEAFPQDLRVTRREMIGARMVALELQSAQGVSLPVWTPGAHVDLAIPGGFTRSYSLIPVAEPATWRIAVLNVPESRGGSRWMHSAAFPDSVVTALGLRNDFTLNSAPGGHVFVAGGVGLTPLLSMIAELREAGRPWELHFSVRDAGDLELAQPLVGLPEVHVYRGSHSERVELAEVCRSLPPDALLYACGPQRMLAEIEAHLGKGDRRYRRELFTAAEAFVDGPHTPFTVKCSRSSVSVDVAPDESILTAVRRVGILVQSSCEEGVCGACETTVVAGEIDHRDSILSDEERESGDTMMICVSRSCDGALVLDL
jgi:ferredoxin-NADP reductase